MGLLFRAAVSCGAVLPGSLLPSHRKTVPQDTAAGFWPAFDKTGCQPLSAIPVFIDSNC